MKDINIYAMEIKNIIDELPHNGDFRQRKIGDITQIVIHHSDSPTGKFGPEDFAMWHMRGKYKMPRIAYHYCIEPDGEVYQTNHLESVSWHAGEANWSSIGILLNGNFEVDEPTKNQLSALRILNKKLVDELGDLDIVGHRDVQATLCPGKNLYQRKNDWVFNFD